MSYSRRQKQARVLRVTRSIHRLLGISLFVFFMIIAITGALLGWKKDLAWMQSKTVTGTSQSLSNWMSIESLTRVAQEYMVKEHPELSPTVDRIDVRPRKGIVKISFTEHYHGLQIDGATGMILLDEYRRADLVENIHDGSWLDDRLGSGRSFKLFYTSVLSMALLGFTLSGFWLWYGPKRMRKKR